MISSLRHHSQLAASVFRRLGLRGAIIYLLHERWPTIFQSVPHRSLHPEEMNGSAYSLYVRDIPFPLLCRSNTSDRWAFGQVFVREEYGDLSLEQNPKLILDCGANVGYTSVYFLEKFPHAQLIAVEPDEQNFEILMQNLAHYGERAHAIHAALWSEPIGLKLCSSPDTFWNCEKVVTQVSSMGQIH